VNALPAKYKDVRQEGSSCC